MTKYLLPIIVVLLASISSIAQSSKEIENRYKNAIKLYVEQKDTLKAIQELEQVAQLKPRYKDVIFDLGAMYLQTGNPEKAVDMFQTGVRIGDRKAADLLKSELKQKIRYYDTMSFEDVDEKPYILVNDKKEEILVNKELNKIIYKPLLAGIRSSKILKKEMQSRSIIIAVLCISKAGEMDVRMLITENPLVQDEMEKIVKSVGRFSPGKHEGKEVVTTGWTLPIR